MIGRRRVGQILFVAMCVSGVVALFAMAAWKEFGGPDEKTKALRDVAERLSKQSEKWDRSTDALKELDDLLSGGLGEEEYKWFLGAHKQELDELAAKKGTDRDELRKATSLLTTAMASAERLQRTKTKLRETIIMALRALMLKGLGGAAKPPDTSDSRLREQIKQSHDGALRLLDPTAKLAEPSAASKDATPRQGQPVTGKP